jgi:hypothetical protein
MAYSLLHKTYIHIFMPFYLVAKARKPVHSALRKAPINPLDVSCDSLIQIVPHRNENGIAVKESPWVALVGPFPADIRPSSRWRDRYQRLPRTIKPCELEEALADPMLDSVLLYWNLPDRLDLGERVLAANRPLCLPGPLTPDELRLLQSTATAPFLGAASLTLPAVRAMRLALDTEHTGPTRYVAVRRLTQLAPTAPHYAPLTVALVTAASLIDDTPDWIFASCAEHKETTTIIVNLHFASAEVMATWVQTPDGPNHDEWMAYGTKGMVHQRDESADHTLVAHLFDHWMSVRSGREEPLMCAEQALTAACLAQAIDRSLSERRRVDWQEVSG